MALKNGRSYPVCQRLGSRILKRFPSGGDYHFIAPAWLEIEMPKYLIAVALIIAPSAALAQAPLQPSTTSGARMALASLEPGQAREDFQLLRHALEEAHPGLYRYSSKAEMDRTFDAFAAKLNRPISTAEFEEGIAGVRAAIRCGHTSLIVRAGFPGSLVF